METVQVTKAQVEKFYAGDFTARLNNRQKRMVVDRVLEQVGPIHSDNRQPLIWYVTGTGDYSKAYLTKNYNLKPLLDLYKKEERKMKKEVEEAIRDVHRAEAKAKSDAEFEEYKKFAKDFIENKNVRALEDAISTYGVPQDPVEALAQVLREYVRLTNKFYENYR